MDLLASEDHHLIGVNFGCCLDCGETIDLGGEWRIRGSP
jgi:hypothetical protein